MDSQVVESFIGDHTHLQAPPFVPEVRLHLADDVMAIWGAAAEAWGDEAIPFWAFAWPGGQALARYILDAAETVAGARVLDFGAGSGLGAIAAGQAGAASVLAADTDLRAAVAIALNAAANGVQVQVQTRDLLEDIPPPVDVILAGDMCYEREVAPRVRAWLEVARDMGARILVGDPGRLYFRTGGLVRLARYSIPVTPQLEDRDVKTVGVFTMAARQDLVPPDDPFPRHPAT